ncbi:hypothetical protein E1281_30620 [Actinomadura sp. KC345]|uniref:hypothetical protein n=1 Tax=Actinomadura sp. KC345 TaxID=2530371 RepID=UPI00104AA25A|nr:hypothetical protein [Actinomadura sp. KC345]TDC45343.1 hypothetical protein E1281_30620 [Actinomadura sp. KC345]
MLAEVTRLGDTSLYVVAPVAIFSALVIWIAMTLMTSRKPPNTGPRTGGTGLPHRGPVQGGVIEGSPAQRNRNDPAPSVTRREVLAHIAAEREREAQQARASETRGRRGGRRGKRSRGNR